uniref:ATP synthase F0 subunit 8 n=1 Tax=Macrolenostreptus orestes TaxID=2931673 RepID=A0A8T9JC09_9MYRI|nr:ATP synthase F0 subunit 8 [Macrolenostreptus orestes]UOF70312.1 ATP synthase F0 subunit 8 [Macrolenostreptus orestes]
MPQMFPMNWTLMFLIFVMTYLLTNIFINYIYKQQPMLHQPSLTKPASTWKW